MGPERGIVFDVNNGLKPSFSSAGAAQVTASNRFGAMVFALALVVCGSAVYVHEQERGELERSRASAIATDHAQDLQQHLQQALSATQALEAMLHQGHGRIENFETLVTSLLPLYPGVSAMAIEPRGVIQTIAPLHGNEAAVGLDLLRHPQRQVEAELARDSGKLTLAGPFELVQGGLGALGFLPVFTSEPNGESVFWGFTNVVVRLPQALGPAQFDQLVKQGYSYRLWRIEPTRVQRQTIAQAGAMAADPVNVDLKVPNGKWTLSVAPTQGWADPIGLALRIALGVLVSALLGWLAKLQWQIRLRADQLTISVSEQTRQINDLNHQLQATLDALPDVLFEISNTGRYLDCHTPRQELLLFPRQTLVGSTLRQTLPPEAAEVCVAALDEARRTGYSKGEQFSLPLDAGVRWFEWSVARKNGKPGEEASFIVLSRDVTDHRKAELQMQRLTRLYTTLSQCNQAIARCHSEAELFPIICRDAVNFGGMKMAWIGRLDESTQRVRSAAAFGSGTEYLDGLDISLDPADVTSQGPTAQAIRSGQPCWCQDFQRDRATTVWHERGARFGWGASAALPLRLKDKVIGSLNLYASEVGAFDEVAQNLLREMTLDIGFALGRFADEVERQKTREQLVESEERYRKAFQTSPDSVNINRLSDGLYLDVNTGFERITGWKRDEVMGKTSAQISIWHDLKDRDRLVAVLKDDGRCLNLEAQFVKKDGTVIHGLMSAVVVRFKDEDCILSISRDITDKKLADARMQQLAHFDQLTGLPNRARLDEHFRYALSLAQRRGTQLALMFLDLDHFKNVNDTLGHSVGDRLLVETARRFSSVLRDEDTLSRLGGDEFILLLPDIDEAGARQVATKLINVGAQACQIERYELVSTVSVGIAMYPHDGEDLETLAKNADAAMYRVKQSSRNDFRFFTQEMQAHSARALQLGNALHHALARNELRLLYQPQIALDDGHVVGVEALLRWHHPELGVISPVEFIPIAEGSGQILEIGEWVLRSAVTQLKAWLDAGLRPMVMSVNLSAVQFRHPDLIELVTRILAQAGLAPHYLELELTEAVAMDDPAAAIDVMDQLSARGVRMSIDDFGTGYSSLSYLKKFKISKLKIDQSFVRDISDDPDDKAIVSAIIKLADSLGLRTIAEGTETASQLDFLRTQGCQEVQGYFFSRPVPKDELEAFVRANVVTQPVPAK